MVAKTEAKVVAEAVNKQICLTWVQHLNSTQMISMPLKTTRNSAFIKSKLIRTMKWKKYTTIIRTSWLNSTRYLSSVLSLFNLWLLALKSALFAKIKFSSAQPFGIVSSVANRFTLVALNGGLAS